MSSGEGSQHSQPTLWWSDGTTKAKRDVQLFEAIDKSINVSAVMEIDLWGKVMGIL